MTALSVLKNVLCLNQNQMHVDKIEDKVEVLHKDCIKIRTRARAGARLSFWIRLMLRLVAQSEAKFSPPATSS